MGVREQAERYRGEILEIVKQLKNPSDLSMLYGVATTLYEHETKPEKENTNAERI